MTTMYLEHDPRTVADWIFDLFQQGMEDNYTVADVISDGIGLEDDLLAVLGMPQDSTPRTRLITNEEWRAAYTALGFDLDEDFGFDVDLGQVED